MDTDTIDNKEESTVQGYDSKTKLRTRGKKRKRSDSSSESEDVLPENALEVEHNLIASAVKNNLDDVSVKKILKKVVTNDHVLALVKLREEEESSNEQGGVRPKLTRAKVKELMKVSPSTAWNLEKIELTPIKHIPVKTRPEVKALIAQELPEDEDDDEYEPTHDDVPSDDDQGLESCSDIDSQPRTPATPRSVSKGSPRVVKDGPFKVPQEISTPSRRKLDMNEEEATIALRTRSKLCLSETPIEHIESSFVPPDEAPIPPMDDHLWSEFLNECLNPASVSRNEDDDETDPEYNVAADPDAHDEDEEALEGSIIKISKKELNDLVTELFNIMPESTVEDELANMANTVLPEHSHNGTTTSWEGKQEPLSDEEHPLKISEKSSFEHENSINKLSIGKSEPVDVDPLALDGTEPTGERAPEEPNEEGKNIPKIVTIPNTTVRIAVNETEYSVKPPPATPLVPPLLLQLQPGLPILQVTVESHPVILPEQIQIVQQQLRQHIQLSTSNFLQLFVHPMHWSLAPTYKEYLESLVSMLESNPSSVVDVCNLRPALELVQQWELTVAKDTPENADMVEFIQKEAQKWRRAMAQNRPYTGDFHETFKKVVANSPVFLYPYLLPPMPLAPDSRRRFNYLHAEDELIALGLEEFWKYVEANPDLFPKPGRSHPRHRWGLQLTTELVIKHMFPWHNVRALMQHVMVQRRHKDMNNPISKFMQTGEVTAVNHKLLPFNPKLSLYEQPEHEMPQVWTKYLAQTSKRFKIFLRGKRREAVTGQKPTGVDVEVGAEPLPKLPLPIDFTKEIRGAKRYPSPPKPVLADKFDVNIEKPTPINFFQLVQTSEGQTLVPLAMKEDNTAKITLVAKTSEDNVNANIPPQERGQTNTVDSNIVPIISAIEVNTAQEQSFSRETEGSHCSCCEIFREICKLKQTVITDFFSSKNKHVNRRKCECNERRRYPTITKRLKLLIKRYKYSSKCLFDDIQRKLKIRKSQNQNESTSLDDKSEEYSMEDLAFVTAFQMKLTIRASVAKNSQIKSRVNTLFSKFDLDWGDPIKLVLELEQAFSTEMVDMLKEFIGFLNPEQADRVNFFKDYFIHNCAEDLVNKIEEQVKDENSKRKLLTQISVFFSGRQWTSCSMCTALLMLSREHPALARYTFALFPHSRRYLVSNSNRLTKTAPTNTVTPPEVVNGDGPLAATDNVEDSVAQAEAEAVADHETPAGVNSEADHSSSGSEEDTERHSITNSVPEPQLQNGHISIVIKTEAPVPADNDASEMMVGKIEIQEYSESDVVMSEDESVKSKPLEWTRDEDKLILEVLKQHIAPEDRQDKTILEIIEEKQIVQILTESITDKSFHEIKERVISILKLLIIGE